MSTYPASEQLTDLATFTGTAQQYAETIRDLWWPDGNGATITETVDDQGSPVVEVRLATAGWSGNEEIVSVIQQSFFHAMFWHMSRRGGLHVYQVPVWAWDYNGLPLGTVGDRTQQEAP